MVKDKKIMVHTVTQNRDGSYVKTGSYNAVIDVVEGENNIEITVVTQKMCSMADIQQDMLKRIHEQHR